MDFGKGCDEVVQYLSLRNDRHPDIRYECLNFAFVVLPRFVKAAVECLSLEDKLIFSLCHAHELKEKPEQFDEGVFDKIFGIAKISTFSLDERTYYEASMKNERDRYAALKCAREEGREEGREDGIGIGRQEAREELLSLLESGVPLADIKQRFGL
ncbi:MAG: Rpn family recombination-promoting nuclease/putative transposase [Fibromonadaceae bacterium]|jgi:hypothetical protein|nr:Rpn family recombination-promoting nuclease/putative transposase [Fibromonadaceae bacterium]